MSEAQETKAVEVEYSFRKKKDETTKRPTVGVNLQLPTVNAIVAILQDASDENRKTRQLVLDQVHQPVIAFIKQKVDADESFNQETLDAIPVDQYSLQAIANMPRSERSSVSKDDLEDFAKDYTKFMVEAEKISEKAAASATVLFVRRFKDAIGDNKVLEKMQVRLQEFMDIAPEEVVTQHAEAIAMLLGKLEEVLSIKFEADAL